MLKQIILRALKRIRVPLKKVILLESNPEMGCNTMPVYEEFVRRGINKNYKIIWLVNDKSIYKNYAIKNVSFINYKPVTVAEKIYYIWVMFSSKCLVFSNRFQYKRWKNQIVINLMHGMPIKSSAGYVEHDTLDYLITSGERFHHVLSEILDVPLNKIKSLGYPRTDVLRTRSGCAEAMGLSGFSKIIIWMPTFRKHKNGIVDGDVSSYGVPLIYTNEDLRSIDLLLRDMNMVLVIKLHPAQDTTGLSQINASNIRFVTDGDINRKGFSLYEFMADTDALITDYSSVYYDYLLTDKPIGLIIDDIEDYNKNRGIVIDYKEVVKGHYIYQLLDLYEFLLNTGKDYDPYLNNRLQTKNLYCDFDDFKSTERVVDFILELVEK